MARKRCPAQASGMCKAYVCVGVELVNDELVLLDARPRAEFSFSAVGSCGHHHCLADLACDQDLRDNSNGGAALHNTQQSKAQRHGA